MDIEWHAAITHAARHGVALGRAPGDDKKEEKGGGTCSAKPKKSKEKSRRKNTGA